MAEEPPRDRSRSPVRGEAGAAAAPGAGAAAAGSAAVPAHWLKPAAAVGDPAASAPAAAGKGGGKGKAAGKRAALLTGTVGEDALDPQEPVTASTLLALALQLEEGKSPEDLAKTIKRAATRMSTLEKAVGELGQAMRAISSVSAQTLAATGLLGGSTEPVLDLEGAGDGDGKSYMFKKGDEDLQEAHRQAAAARPSTATSHGPSGGGALSAEAKSRQEMDAARQARLARLEAAQADKVKEREAADAKSRAREGLFERPFVGGSKTLGKH